MFNNISKNVFVMIAAIIILFLLLLAYQIGIGFTTNDGLMFEIFSLSENIYLSVDIAAHAQGRFQFYYLIYLAILPHFFHNILIYNLFTFLGISLAFISISYFMAYFTKKHLIGFLTIIYLLSMYQNGWGHSLITAYAFYFWLFLACFMIAIVYLDKFILENNKKNFFVYSLSMFYALSYETFVLFFILFTSFIIHKNWSLLKENKIKLLGLIYLPLIVFLGIYISFKILTLSDQTYGGTKLNLDIVAIWQTMWQYSIGGFPGYYFFDGTYSSIIAKYQANFSLNKFDLFLAAMGISMFMKMASIIFTSYTVAYNFRSTSAPEINSKNLTILGLLFLSFVFSANFLQALTPKYQEWVLKLDDPSYIGSSFSAIGFVILLVILLIAITKIEKASLYKKTLTLYITFLTILSFATSYTNFYLKQDQIQSSEKLLLLDRIIESEAFQRIYPLTTIYASSLFTTKHGIFDPSKEYWSAYVSLKRELSENNGLFIENKDIENKRYYIKYIENTKSQPSAYMMLIDKISNDIFIYFSAKVPNFQLIANTNDNILVDIYKNKTHISKNMTSDGIVRVENISLEENDVLHLHSSAPIDENSIYLNFPDDSLNLIDVNYNFESGFYQNEGTSRWSGPENDSSMKIVNFSKNNTPMVANFSIHALTKKKIRVYLNDKLIKEIHIDKESIKYGISLDNIMFKPGVNYLKFENLDGTQSPPNSSDTRKLGFAISNFMLSKGKGNS